MAKEAIFEQLRDEITESADDIYPSLSPFGTTLSIDNREPREHCEYLCLDQPCYSAHLVRAFLRFCRRYDRFPTCELDDLENIDIDERIPVVYAHKLVQKAILYTRDPDLGLKAASEIPHGEIGTLDFAMSAAPTVRESLEIASRYQRLVGDSIDIQLRVENEQAQMRVENSAIMPRPLLDFLLAIFYRNHVYRWSKTTTSGYYVYFDYGKPDNGVEYDLTFPSAGKRFCAPFSGFVFPEATLHTPLTTADENLYAIMQKHARLTISALPRVRSTTDRVRDLLSTELANGGPYAKRIAQQLTISDRTLIRRLEYEGATFKSIIDDVRRRLALVYVGGRDIEFGEVAALLGFSHVTAFHRAFKRWTDQTPLQYRRLRRW